MLEEDYGTLENAVRDVKEYTAGDFVEYIKVRGSEEIYCGIVTKAGKDYLPDDSIVIEGFVGVYPAREIISPKLTGCVRKIKSEEGLKKFRKIATDFNETIKAGGNKGALTARWHYNINNLIEEHPCLMSFRERFPLFDSVSRALHPVLKPSTGIYVVGGLYFSSTRSGPKPERLEGLIVKPNIDEKNVAKVLKGLSPRGFGKITNEARNSEDDSYGLRGYSAVQIPEDATHLVENPRTLEWKL